jgi:hypothetical protein
MNGTSRGEIFDEASNWLMGGGIMTLALAPPALPGSPSCWSPRSRSWPWRCRSCLSAGLRSGRFAFSAASRDWRGGCGGVSGPRAS